MAVYCTSFIYFLLAILITLSPLQSLQISCFPHNDYSPPHIGSYSDLEWREEIPHKRICPGYRLYLNKTRKCYEYLSRGPCPETMLITSITDSYELGKCACPPGNCYRESMFPWRVNNRCYNIYTQGPCSPGQWLVPKVDEKLSCERNPCLNAFTREPINRDGVVKMFSYGGKCYTNRASNPDLCQPGERIAIVSGWNYSCHKEDTGYSCAGVVVSPDNRCENGYQADEFGGCEPSVDIH